ncbi:hypothetical protein FRX31_029502 [Thalictrum thalictroides]|uniref:Uncharacterized protein n=1 Tax=Thalictrum thalictroides TaxID=46969 RepID=A0A7J6V8I0_THATH|nr:hypothetical protein FRX31_029502 [Thalictrum thalictroides]
MVQLWGALCDTIEEGIQLKREGKPAYVILTSLITSNWQDPVSTPHAAAWGQFPPSQNSLIGSAIEVN